MVTAKHAQRIAVGLGLALGLLFCLSLEAFGAPPGPTHSCPNWVLCSPDIQSLASSAGHVD